MAQTRTQLIQTARHLRSRGHHDAAAQAWSEAIALSPDEPVLYHNLAAALGDAHRYAEAVAALEAGFGKGLSAPQSQLVLARAKAGLLALDEAEAAYRRYLATAPADVTAQSELAELVWMRTADTAAALAVLDEAIRDAPGDVDLVVTRCRLIGEMGDRRAELACLGEALGKLGGHPILHSAASAAALACGDMAAGLSHAAAVAKATPGDRHAMAAHAGALIAVGAYPEAQAVIDSLRARYPEDQHYLALQGDLWRLTGDGRRDAWFDYARIVFRAPLEAPRGWRSAEAYVDDLTAALDARHTFRTHPFFQSVRGGGQISSITSFDEPAMRAYHEAVAPAARAYADKLGQGPEPVCLRNAGDARLFSAWSVLLPAHGYHENHVHPEGWVSSACHLRHDPRHDQSRGGWLKFGESGLRTPVPLPTEHIVKPERGVAVLFPSYVWHGTVPFAEGTPRLTVAADFVPA